MISSDVTTQKQSIRAQYFTQNARSAFLMALKLLSIQKRGKILLPAYIGINDKEGSGVFDPIRALGVDYEFYALDANLAVVKEDFKRKVSQPDVAAVLVIHYFGFCAGNFDYVYKLCRAQKKFLIEDCAHALDSYHDKKKLGTFGDAAFYSLHKILPVETGGILAINNSKIEIPNNLKDDINSESLAAYRRADWGGISATRRTNFKYLARKLGKIKPFYKTLPEGIVPMNFPVIIDMKNRDEVYFKLRDWGVPAVSLYYRLISEIDKSEYPASYRVSSHILNLPIHQSLTISDMDQVTDKLYRAIS